MKYLFLALLMLVPGYTLAGNTYGVQQYVVKQKVVQFDHPLGVSVIGLPVANLGLRYYYSIRTELSEKELNRLKDKVIESLESDVPADETSTETEVPTPELREVDSTEVEAILLTKCGSCHKADSDSGFQIVALNEDGESILNPELTKLDWWNIFDRVDGSHLPKDKIMPKNGDPLSQEYVNVIRNYVRSL